MESVRNTLQDRKQVKEQILKENQTKGNLDGFESISSAGTTSFTETKNIKDQEPKLSTENIEKNKAPDIGKENLNTEKKDDSKNEDRNSEIPVANKKANNA